MASRIGVRERRRRQVEQLLASGMEVREWCELNRVGRGALYAWLTEFRDTEPELFGGYEVAHAGDGHRNWFEHVRNAMAERSALALRGPAPAFAVVESLGLDPPAADGHPSAAAAGAPIVVAVNGVTVEVPAGSAEPDVACVLRAVMSL